MRDEVEAGQGFEWVTVGVNVDGAEDSNPEPSGPPIVVPSRVRVMRYDEADRLVMRIEVGVVKGESGEVTRGVTGVQIFAGAEGFIDSATLRAIGVDGQVDGFVRESARTLVPADTVGEGFQADERAWGAATYAPLPATSESLRFSLRRVAPAGPAVARQDRRRTLDEEAKKAAEIYRESLRRSAEHGGRARPVDDVADYLGLERRTAARRIAEARARGYLPPTSQGRAQA